MNGQTNVWNDVFGWTNVLKDMFGQSNVSMTLGMDNLLTLIGMRGDTFISLSFLDQILSAGFLSKHSKLL